MPLRVPELEEAHEHVREQRRHVRLRPEVFLPKTESLVKTRANALAADPFAVHAHALGHPRGRFRVVAAHLRVLAPRPRFLVSPIVLQVGFRRQRRGAALAFGDFLPLQLGLVPSMVPLLPLLRLRLVHAPERERGGVPLALRGARAVGQREEVDALTVRFPSRELAAVASTVGEGEPTPAVLVPVGVHLPAEDALAILVELLDQAGEFAVVPEARAPGAVAREVLGVSLDGVVDEGPHHAIPSRGESLERGLGHRPVFTIAILILILILVLVLVCRPRPRRRESLIGERGPESLRGRDGPLAGQRQRAHRRRRARGQLAHSRAPQLVGGELGAVLGGRGRRGEVRVSRVDEKRESVSPRRHRGGFLRDDTRWGFLIHLVTRHGLGLGLESASPPVYPLVRERRHGDVG
mmetsp:Transcript_4846/g.22194  ORF Transcript_4846/g.22194 Transcript_4846/m.22194 type:complete len:409 (-) Transcript_4846:68-1294(-)